jgi:hypothetical protein
VRAPRVVGSVIGNRSPVAEWFTSEPVLFHVAAPNADRGREPAVDRHRLDAVKFAGVIYGHDGALGDELEPAADLDGERRRKMAVRVARRRLFRCRVIDVTFGQLVRSFLIRPNGGAGRRG